MRSEPATYTKTDAHDEARSYLRSTCSTGYTDYFRCITIETRVFKLMFFFGCRPYWKKYGCNRCRFGNYELSTCRSIKVVEYHVVLIFIAPQLPDKWFANYFYQVVVLRDRSHALESTATLNIIEITRSLPSLDSDDGVSKARCIKYDINRWS
jgi:hypothetical protein